MEQISPFNSEYFSDLVTTTIDDSDLKKQGIYSDISIVERYKTSREKIQA